ncbi:hypothetical protein CALVIDRAFT_560289 [Calocera viscosa TUFC12733]|uniref:NAD(P)-binding domain-containing protein n=1 Tax=Calocera viscosa (strain TUFC12733) TaxID=1330018 RepID=A0A167RK85_CALVF|nr:hypothetical protein CALVIDRAFT_560289 [Calocera viscosa TUFC12733]
MTTQNVLFLGASRGCGFFAALALLKSGGHATLLLRKPEAVTSNTDYELLSPEEKARATLVTGDAFVEADVQKAVDAAGEGMDTVVFSIGGTPHYEFPLSFPLDVPDVCARSVSILLTVLHKLNRPGLRLIAVSSMGIGAKYYDLPLLLRPLYGIVLHGPHVDKEALEYLVLKASKFPTPPAPDASAIPAEAASVPSDWLDEVVLVRPALLTDGAEFGKLRKAVTVPGAYTVSRRDTGKFIVDECLKGSDQWVGEQGVVIAY